MTLLVQVLQRNRTNKIYIGIQKGIYYEGLAHRITEVERSHDLLSASWSLGKPVAQSQSKSDGLRARVTNGAHPSLSLMAQEPGVPMFEAGSPHSR